MQLMHARGVCIWTNISLYLHANEKLTTLVWKYMYIHNAGFKLRTGTTLDCAYSTGWYNVVVVYWNYVCKNTFQSKEVDVVVLLSISDQLQVYMTCNFFKNLGWHLQYQWLIIEWFISLEVVRSIIILWHTGYGLLLLYLGNNTYTYSSLTIYQHY